MTIPGGTSQLAAPERRRARRPSAPRCSMFVVSAVCSSLLLSVQALAQEPSYALADSDFSIAGFGTLIDTNAALQVLGPPISRDTTLHTWHYDGLSIHFGTSLYTSHVWLFRIDGPRYATRRGLHVGDSVARVVELYGPLWRRPGRACEYGHSSEYGRSSRGMRLQIEGDTVRVIWVGAVSCW